MVWNAFGNGAGWNPWRELSEFQAELDRFPTGSAFASMREEPPIEVWRNEDGLRLRAQIPGLAADSLELSVEGDVLTLKGKRIEPEETSFARTIRLPFSVDGDAAKARYEDGILDVELPRSPAEKPRKIQVKGA